MKQTLTCFWIAIGALSIGLFVGSSRAPTNPFPLSDLHIKRIAYDLLYDGMHKQPRWVHERLTADQLKGSTERGPSNFQEDPLIPSSLRATKEDYRGSGFHRGHLCPAANAKFSEEAMRETFFLSNISPQHPQLNQGPWAQLEKHIRTLAAFHASLHVFTGPLFLSHLEADGKRYITYQVIGAHEVAVPTHYFKILFNETTGWSEAYILPNEPIDANTPLDTFKTTIEAVEKAAGFVLNNKYKLI